MSTWATWLTALARSISIGWSLSLSASRVSERWLRRSVILFFMLPQLPLQGSRELDDFGQFFREVMDCVARHQSLARDAFEVSDRHIGAITVFENHRVAAGNRAMVLLPDMALKQRPDLHVSKPRGLGFVTLADLDAEITLRIGENRADPW